MNTVEIAKDVERQLTLIALRGNLNDCLEDGAIYIRRVTGKFDCAQVVAHGGNGLSSEEDVAAWFAVEKSGFVPDIVPEEDGSHHWLVAHPPSDKQKALAPADTNVAVPMIVLTSRHPVAA